MDKIELGDEVSDTVTPFKGVVIGVTEWLNGCKRMSVLPRELTDKGSMPMSESFDETQLIIVKKRAVVAQNTPRDTAPEVTLRKTGGPRPEPQRQASPKPF